MNKSNLPVPENEEERLKVLHSYNILDSFEEEELNEIAELAAIICDVPIGLVSIIDKDRQWFKARVGLAVKETPRAHSFCQYSIMQTDYFEVEDAQKDDRFKDNPLVTGSPNIRFYGSYPLYVEGNIALGSFCVISDQPKRLNDNQKKALKIFSKQISNYFKLQKEKEDKDRYERFFNETGELLALGNTKGYFSELNPAFYEKLGYEKTELLETPFIDLIHPEDIDRTKEEIKQLENETTTVSFTNRCRTKKGNFLRLAWSMTLKPDEQDILYFSAKDITAQYEAELLLKESEIRYRAFFEHAQGILVTLDLNGKLTAISSAITKLTGVDAQQHIGSSLTDIFDLSKEESQQFYEKLEQEGNTEILLKILDRKQTELLYYFRATLVRLGDNEEYIMMTGIDISDRIKIEEELKEAKKLADENSRVKEDFLANMSHEIRTPLNAIIGFADILDGTKLNERQQEFIKGIQKAGRYLLSIINDILDLSKIGSKQLSLESEPFQLLEFFDQLKAMFVQEAKSRNLFLDFELDKSLPSWVIGDSARFKQILVNLLGNAIKFTKEGGVKLVCKYLGSTSDSDLLEIRVIDTGIGISEEKQRNIFERFNQGHQSVTREFGGSGLGLSIVKELLELQGGEMILNSELGKGSEFIVQISFKKSRSLEEKVEEIAEKQEVLLQAKILLVEDNEFNQVIAQEYLENMNLEVITAFNGKEAIELLEKQEVDLILMDLQMPVMNGYEATGYIRNNLKLEIPIIALTAHSFIEEKDKCINLGMNAYLTKPYKIQDLYECLKGFLPVVGDAEEETLSFDVDRILDLAEGNHEFSLKLVTTFIDKTPPKIEELFQAAVAKDTRKIADVAHSIKPSFDMLGYRYGYELCLFIEKNPSVDDIEDQVAKLAFLNNKLISFLKDHFNIDR